MGEKLGVGLPDKIFIGKIWPLYETIAIIEMRCVVGFCTRTVVRQMVSSDQILETF